MLKVTGRATFVSKVQKVATGSEGDAKIKGIGADLVSASISGPDPWPWGKELIFTLKVADPPPSPATGVPEGLTYMWMFANYAKKKLFRAEISTGSRYNDPDNSGPVGVLVECPIDGEGATCPATGTRAIRDERIIGPGYVYPIPVEIDGGEITFRATLDQLDLTSNSTKPSWFRTEDRPGLPLPIPGSEGTWLRGISTQLAVPSSSTGTELATGGDNRIDHLPLPPFHSEVRPPNDYIVPAPVVRVGAGLPSTPMKRIPLHVQADLGTDGRFGASLREYLIASGPHARAPVAFRRGKSYRIVVEACYGVQSCRTWDRVMRA